MNQGVQELFEAALALSDEEQQQLVTALVAAADERGLLPPDAEWLAEIRRRSDEYDAGRAGTAPWAEVRSRAWRKAAERG